MEKKDLINDTNVDYLTELYTGANRRDLVKQIKEFQRNPDFLKPRKLPESSNHQSLNNQNTHKDSSGALFSADKSFSSIITKDFEKTDVFKGSYKMTANPRGICLIINNYGINVEKLVQAFQYLLFKTVVYSNLMADEIYDELRNISQNDHRKYDCFITCFLSHGTTGTINDNSGKELLLSHVFDLFESANCCSLIGKPKIFIIHTGRKQQTNNTVVAYSSHMTESENNDCFKKILLPKEVDFFCGYSLIPSK